MAAISDPSESTETLNHEALPVKFIELNSLVGWALVSLARLVGPCIRVCTITIVTSSRFHNLCELTLCVLLSFIKNPSDSDFQTLLKYV